MRIDGWTLVLQAINFLILVVLLRRFLYRPVVRAITARKEQTEKALAEAAAARAAADADRAQLAGERTALLAERDRMVEQARATIETERQRAIEAARADTEAIHVAARDQLAEERTQASAALRRQAVELALELSSAILRSSASPAVAEALLDQIVDRLAITPPEELGRLHDQVSNGRVLEIVTAPALTPERQGHLRQRLATQLGLDAHAAFASDDRLIAGAELRFPGTVFAMSWRDAIERAREELTRDTAA